MGGMRGLRRATVLAIAFVVAGCGGIGAAGQVEDGGPRAGCQAEQFEAGVRVLGCVEAVQAAEASLDGLHWPISEVTFERFGLPPGVPCPANARCVPPTMGLVVFEFWVGDPVRILVSLDENGRVMAEPAPPAEDGVPLPNDHVDPAP